MAHSQLFFQRIFRCVGPAAVLRMDCAKSEFKVVYASGMKRYARNILIGGFLFVSGVAGLVFWNAQKVGRVLDSYRSVPVYDNGLLFFRSYGKHYSKDGYYYGQKW